MKRLLLAGFSLALLLAAPRLAEAQNNPLLNAVPKSCSALCTNIVLKPNAGGLYSFEVNADATLSAAAWYILIYNAATPPADGAVTPTKCFAVASGQTQAGATYATYGISFPLGMVIAVSTTGCFTQTSSTHAFISGDYQ